MSDLTSVKVCDFASHYCALKFLDGSLILAYELRDLSTYEL